MGKLFVITGPTAAGKTEYAVKLALRYGLPVINADSRQVYREMKIGTARPDPEELKGVPHYFLAFRSILHPYTAGRFGKDVRRLLPYLYSKYPAVLLTGGSGLYIKAVTEGLADIPSPDQKYLVKYENILKQEGVESLYARLMNKDPKYAEEVDFHNHRRLIRALSVINSTGKKFSDWRKEETSGESISHTGFAILPERELLYRRINERVDHMLRKGLLSEVKKLYPLRFLRSLDTVGYREPFQYFSGEIDRMEMMRLIKRNTRRYAKRQFTWIRNNQDEYIIDSGYFENCIEQNL